MSSLGIILWLLGYAYGMGLRIPLPGAVYRLDAKRFR